MAQHELKQLNISEPELDIADDKRQLLDELRSLLAPKGSPYSDFTNHCMYRFLSGNKFSPAQAADALTAYVEWRNANNIDNYVDPNPAVTKQIQQLCPYSYIGFDKQGRPVYYEKTGLIQCWAMAQLTGEQEFLNSHTVGMNLISQRCQESTLKLGRVVDEFTVVFDLTGLGLGHRNVINFLRVCAEFDAKYFPEKIGKIIILNAPWVANVLWPAVQAFLPAVLQARIEIVSGDAKSTLLKYIDEDQIPTEYGGSNPAGVEVHDCTEILSKLQTTQADDGLDKTNVAAGGKYSKTIECDEKGGNFTWFFESVGGYDVEFSVVIESAAGRVVAKQPSRCTTSKGSYESTTACKVTFEWDNSFSWVYSKDVKYCVAVTPLSDIKC